MTIQEQDKAYLLKWLHLYAHGVRNAMTRKDILPNLRFTAMFNNEESKDRYMRARASELIHEGHACSHNQKGYWAIPLCTNDHEEIEAVIESIQERKAKALTMLADCDKQLSRYETLKQGQMEIARC